MRNCLSLFNCCTVSAQFAIVFTVYIDHYSLRFAAVNGIRVILPKCCNELNAFKNVYPAKHEMIFVNKYLLSVKKGSVCCKQENIFLVGEKLNLIYS